MKKALIIGLLLAGAYFTWSEHGWQGAAFTAAEGGASRSSETFVAPQSGQQTRGTGVVTRILDGDNVLSNSDVGKYEPKVAI